MTTPVGSIKFDLSIDGSGLPTELLREIQGAIAPVLADLQRRLNEIERDYTHLSRESEKSAAKQTAAARTVTEAVEDIGDEHTKTAQKAVAAGRVTTRQINAQTRAYERQTAAILANTAARAANAASPTASGPPPGRGGGGGSGGGRGGSGAFGDLFTGQGGGGRFITSPVGLNAIALGVGSLPAVATAVANVAGAVQQLVQVGAVVPGVIGGIVSSVGTLKLGMMGVSDAISDVWEAAKSGDPAELASALEEIDKAKYLAPEVKKLARTVGQDLYPQFERFQRDIIAQPMFEGITDDITGLVGKALPTAERGLGGIARAWNGTFRELLRVGGSDSTLSFMDRVFGNTAEAQTRANAAIEPLAHAIGTLTAESSDFLPRLADGATAALTRLDNWVTKSAENGNLDKWIDQGITAAGNLGETLLNVGKIITSITQAAGGDGGLLQALEDGSTALANFLASEEGQAKLTAFFTEGRAQLEKWWPILQNVGSILVDVYEGMKQWTDVLLPVLGSITGVISSMPGGIQAVVTAFLAWKTISGITSVIGQLTSMGGLLDGIPGKAKGSASGFALAFNPATLGITALMFTISELVQKIKDDNEYVARQADPNIPQEVKDQERQQKFYPNLGRLPTTAESIPEPGTLMYETLLDDLKTGRIEMPGIDASNAEQALAQVAEQAANARANTELLANDIQTLPSGQVVLKENTPEIIERVKALGYEVQKLPDGNVNIVFRFTDPNGNPIDPSQFRTPGYIPAFPGESGRPRGGGRADGGVIPGYSPGVDNVLWPLSGGEGIVIPEAMRALGSGWLYNLNSSFRAGISRKGYADGGVVGATGTLANGGDPVLALLSEIRDLLAGKGGGGPLADTASATSQIAESTKTAGQTMGPFGTPIKARNPGYEMAAAAIQALGGDPEKFLGANPADYVPKALSGGIGGVGGAGDYTRYASALAAFARSGDLADVTALGLNANDPVITALASARNKSKNGLSDDQIAALVEQIVGGPGYTGTLDAQNTPLIKSLTRYREQLAKQQGVPTTAALAATGLPAVVGGPKGSKEGLLPAAAQLWDLIATQFPQVREIGGVRQDPHPDHPSGRAIDIMIPGGTTRGGANPAGKALGDQMWQFLIDNGLIDPTGSLWQTDTGGDHFDHIHARIREGMENALPGLTSLPGSLGESGTNALGSAGGVVPVYVTNFDGQMRGGFGQDILGAAIGAGGEAATGVAGDVMSGVTGLGQEPWATKNASYATLNQLVRERNPLALAKALGLNVQDFTRQGGDPGEIMGNDGQAFDASGRMFSDTSSILDRTFTNLNAQMQAMREQLVDVIEQTNQKLNEEALEPVVKAGVQSALEGLKDSVTSSIGTAMGNAAGPPIADAVRSAIPTQAGAQTSQVVQTAAAAVPGMAAGGAVSGGTPGKDSVPALLMPGEFVLSTNDVQRLGGIGAVEAMRQRGFRRYATGGGVVVNDVVGAEFFGVSQIPIIGMIVNILVRVLLSVLGVEIEARDTLNEMTDEFRQFRGEFQGFDATGRLLNDTSALMDRSQSSEEIAAQERIRILKIVIQELIKYIIEKVIVPIAKAVANAAISAGASAAGAAINTQAPGAGGIVSSLISSAGSAGVDIIAEIGTDLALAITDVAVDAVAEGLQTLFPGLMNNIFGGGLIEQFIAGPTNAALQIPLAMIGALTGGLGALFAPLAGLVGGLSFDSGGVARGMGMMPKATIAPERVLSPQQTVLFERMVAALERRGSTEPGSHTVIQVGEGAIQVAGGPEAAENVYAGLRELMRS
ncbi:hypothetical protein ACRCUN_06310 [Mycobacterium sp. LTG2003]